MEEAEGQPSRSKQAPRGVGMQLARRLAEESVWRVSDLKLEVEEKTNRSSKSYCNDCIRFAEESDKVRRMRVKLGQGGPYLIGPVNAVGPYAHKIKEEYDKNRQGEFE